MFDRKIRVGVIGVGHLGQHHARILSQLPGASLAGILDVNASRAKKFSQRYKTAATSHLGDLLSQVDAVIIAVPTELHYHLTKECLKKSIHCLVEKPMTETVEQAEDLIILAKEKNVVLQVGHVERFNPAVREMARHVRDPVFIEVNRLGPYVSRAAGTGVVLDLMIHDLDIILSLVRQPVIGLEALGTSLLSNHEDIVKVTMKFSGGCRADLSASRISLKTFRKIRVFQRDAYLTLDYSDRSLRIYKKKVPEVRSLSDIRVIKPRIDKKEPLQAELEHFLLCVKQGRTSDVPGEHGRDALSLAWEIQKIMTLHTVQ